MKQSILAALLLIAGPAFAGGGFNNDCNGVGNCNTVNRVHNNNSVRTIDNSINNDNISRSNAEGGNGYGLGIAGANAAGGSATATGGTGLGTGYATAETGPVTATSGDSISGASAVGGSIGDTSAGSVASIGGSGNSDVSVDGTGGASNVSVQDGGTQFNSDTRALALSLPAATPGFGASAPCLETTRGWTVAGVGASGRTEINSECYQDKELQLMFKNCMDVTQTYVAMGLMGEARDQMEACRVLAIRNRPVE